ncbi:hypothetical protein EDD22DRAFT_853073, partial [Suillus occidentalis]
MSILTVAMRRLCISEMIVQCSVALKNLMMKTINLEMKMKMMDPTDQWYGSSQESLVEQFEAMYESELELDYEKAHNSTALTSTLGIQWRPTLLQRLLWAFDGTDVSRLIERLDLKCCYYLPKLITHSGMQGDFVGVDHVDFIGYLILGTEPTCRTTLHAELKNHITLYAYVATSVIHFSAFEPAQSKEVPVFTNSFGFPPKGTRIGPITGSMLYTTP